MKASYWIKLNVWENYRTVLNEENRVGGEEIHWDNPLLYFVLHEKELFVRNFE